MPLEYVLLANKTRTMYFNMFTVIRNAMSKLGLVLNPDNIVSDFELSFIDVVKQHFPRSRHIGYCKSLWRIRVQELGLSVMYKEDEDFRLHIQTHIALAFCRLMRFTPLPHHCINSRTVPRILL